MGAILGRVVLAGVAGLGMVVALVVTPGTSAPEAGRAASWGLNTSAQLGNATTTDSSVPVAVNTAGVLAGKTVTAINAGGSHTCAVAEGRAYCWGINSSGQLGNATTTNSSVPVAVNTAGVLAGKTVTAVNAGSTHSCVVAEGRAYCWGINSSGQLGNATTTDSSVPVAVNTAGVLAGKTVTAINAGGSHTCAVAEGRAYCWGNNAYGRLGNATTTNSSVPVAVNTTGVLATRTVTAISAGGFHSCAVAEGRAYCWGINSSGQLGNATTTDSSVPVAVNTTGPLAARTVTSTSAGFIHSCVVAEGRASCWGFNNDGQLGNATTTNSSVPVAVNTTGVLAGETITAVEAGGYHTCAVAEGRASCWGFNGYGQLGNATTTNSSVPVTVEPTGVLAGKTVTAVTAGHLHSAVLFAAAPQPPSSVSAVPGDQQAVVSWNPPADDGGSPLLDYTATATPGGATCTTDSTSCTVSGLTNATSYTFTVSARNAIGTSAPSPPSAPVTPTAPVTLRKVTPGKVTGAKAKLGKHKVKITWEAVPGATSYKARITKPGKKKYKAWQTTSKRVFKAKVRESTKYRVQVAAVGPGGRGPITTLRFKSN